jgi:hypothetical protein
MEPPDLAVIHPLSAQSGVQVAVFDDLEEAFIEASPPVCNFS